MVVTNFLVGYAGPLAVGFFHRANQPGVGGKILDCGEPSGIVDFIQDYQCQDLSDTGNGSKQVQGVLIMLAGSFFDMPFEFFEDLVERIDYRQIDFNAFPDLRIFKSLGHTIVIVFSGQLFIKGRQVVLGVGVYNMGHQFRAASDKIHALTQ